MLPLQFSAPFVELNNIFEKTMTKLSIESKNPKRITVPSQMLLLKKMTPFTLHSFKNQSLQILFWYSYFYTIMKTVLYKDLIVI